MQTNFHILLFEKYKMVEHSMFQCNVFTGKNRLYEELTKILTCELMSQCNALSKVKINYIIY